MLSSWIARHVSKGPPRARHYGSHATRVLVRRDFSNTVENRVVESLWIRFGAIRTQTRYSRQLFGHKVIGVLPVASMAPCAKKALSSLDLYR